MQLHIKRTGDNEGWTTSYWLRDPDGGDMSVGFLHARIADRSLSFLAKRWFLIHGKTGETDRNDQLLSDVPGADAKLEDMVTAVRKNKVFRFTSNDPIIIAAMDERVKRAFAMIGEDMAYEQYVDLTREDVLKLGTTEAQPSGDVYLKQPATKA
jgi:hypothetical protein